MQWCRRCLVASLTLLASTAVLLATGASAVAAGSGNIDNVESEDGTVRVLYSIEGLPEGEQPDLSSVTVRVDGTEVDATATLASTSGERLGRVTVLTLDVSKTMQGRPFNEAKQAALAFIDQAPSDVEIGLVTFASTVDTLVEPTLDRDLLRDQIEGLQLSLETHLYEGIATALSVAGVDGQRRLLVLSDGRLDTTGSPLADLAKTVKRSGARVDVVSLGEEVDSQSHLSTIADAGQGSLVSAADPTALTDLFTDEAQALASQILVSFPVPAEKAGSDADLVVSVAAGGTTYDDNAFVSLGLADPASVDSPPALLPVDPPGFVVPRPLLIGGIVAIGFALLLAVAGALGVFQPKVKVTLTDRLAAYGTEGASPAPAPANVRESALKLTQKAIGGGGFEAKLARKLDAAGLSLKPAEWVLLHAGIAVVFALAGFLLTSGGIPLTLLMLTFGVLAPRFYLGHKVSRRIKAFNAQLSESLQLMSGGLKAGLSLAQSVDTIVREGTEPMAGEFRRALIEARLGVDIEDALDGVSERMSSDDFRWVVMAIRIQRQVGGNLAELMLTVAATLREREYLRRQVLTLSAEGRLSAWVLGGLPPAFMVFLVLTQREYVSPMFSTLLGWVMLGFAAMLLAVGSFWMSKSVKVEV